MSLTARQLVPALLVPFIAWRVYMRVRRNIGRQPYHPGRMIVRAIFFGVITLLLGAATLGYWPSLAGLAGGILLGVPLAIVGLRLTRFESSPEGKFYTPNTAIGIALTLLLVGRMGYRIIVLFVDPPIDQAPPALFQSPLTMLMFGVTAGYYIAYSLGVLIRGKKI